MTILLDGKSLAKRITDKLTDEVKTLPSIPHLVVILVGNNPSSEIYVRNKHKKAESIGIKSTVINLDENTDEQSLLRKIEELNTDDTVHGILVQLPVPKHINEKNIIESISPKKDVDGITKENSGMLLNGLAPHAYPCTPKGILTILDEYQIEIEGKNVVVIGRSNIVGKPLSIMLLNRNATVTMAHSKTQNLKDITKTADILISAVGKKIISADMIKENATVIDVGIFRAADGKLSGDVYFDEIFNKAFAITPVPGGVGPMTIASLMQNTVELYKKSNL